MCRKKGIALEIVPVDLWRWCLRFLVVFLFLGIVFNARPYVT